MDFFPLLWIACKLIIIYNCTLIDALSVSQQARLGAILENIRTCFPSSTARHVSQQGVYV